MLRLILILILMLLTSCEKEKAIEPARPVKAIQVEKKSSTANQLIFPGSLRAFKRADLSFRVDGTVILRDISVGEKIKADELLIQLDPREYEIAVQKAKGKVESIRAQLDFAERDYERMKNIYTADPGAISESFLDRKKETFNQLKGEHIIAKSELEKAEDDLSYTTLKAPFDGIIAAIYVENHEQVRAKQVVLRFMDTNDREMRIDIPEKFINKLIANPKQIFKVILDAFPSKIFKATIKEIGTEASSTTHTYPVTLSLKDVPEEFSLLSGMTGKAILEESSTTFRPTFKIPKSAVFTENLNQNYVWVIDTATETVHKTPIKTEENGNGDSVIVQSGIKPGDWIVIAGTSFLSEGQKVKLSAEQKKP